MDRRSFAIRAGLAAPPVAVGGVLLAALLAPDFGWWAGTLSHVGEATDDAGAFPLGQPEVLLFNLSLVVAGLLGLAFAWLCYAGAYHPLERSGAAALFVAFLALAGTGAFPQPSPYHTPALIVQVVATTTALWIYGAGAFNAGRTRFGLGSLALGLVLLAVWLAWNLVLAAPGTAGPVFVGVVVLSAWTFVEAAGAYEANEGRSVGDGVRDAVDRVTSGPAD